MKTLGMIASLMAMIGITMRVERDRYTRIADANESQRSHHYGKQPKGFRNHNPAGSKLHRAHYHS